MIFNEYGLLQEKQLNIKVYDKISYHENYPIEKLVKFFKFLFDWLDSKGYLNKNGKELLDYIDSDISIHSGLLTASGNTFMAKYYDDLLLYCNFDIKLAKEFLSLINV